MVSSEDSPTGPPASFSPPGNDEQRDNAGTGADAQTTAAEAANTEAEASSSAQKLPRPNQPRARTNLVDLISRDQQKLNSG